MSNTDRGAAAPALTECAAGSDTLLALCRDFEQGRLSHATLLCGESGVGKRTLAHLLAQGLLCKSAGPRPCGQCRDCRRFADRSHPDALFPVPASKEKSIKIESLRDTIDALSRHALEGGNRVVVIDQAERMTVQAQNCLLKTLEEADGGVYFLLTADQESAVLPTVRSRCRVVRMQPWSVERLEGALLSRGIAPERARLLAAYCDGSLGRALQMEGDEAYWKAREAVQRTFLSVRKTADIAAAAQALRDQKDQADKLLDILEQELRALLHEKTLDSSKKTDDFPPHWRGATPSGICTILEAVLRARRQRAANVSWAALSEGLMQTISEEIQTWQA